MCADNLITRQSKKINTSNPNFSVTPDVIATCWSFKHQWTKNLITCGVCTTVLVKVEE